MASPIILTEHERLHLQARRSTGRMSERIQSASWEPCLDTSFDTRTAREEFDLIMLHTGT